MKQENLEWMVTTICHLLLPGGHKNTKESTIYYIENKKKAIFTYCVAGVCATLEIH